METIDNITYQRMLAPARLAMRVFDKVVAPVCKCAVHNMENGFDFEELVVIWYGVSQLLGGDEWRHEDKRIDRTARFIAGGILSQDWSSLRKKEGAWR